jgi:hypothetical protein
MTTLERSYQAASQVFAMLNTIMASALNLGDQTTVSKDRDGEGTKALRAMAGAGNASSRWQQRERSEGLPVLSS